MDYVTVMLKWNLGSYANEKSPFIALMTLSGHGPCESNHFLNLSLFLTFDLRQRVVHFLSISTIFLGSIGN